MADCIPLGLLFRDFVNRAVFNRRSAARITVKCGRSDRAACLYGPPTYIAFCHRESQLVLADRGKKKTPQKKTNCHLPSKKKGGGG